MGGNIKKLVKTVAPIALGSFLGPVGGSFVQAGLGKLISNPTVLKALSGAVSQGGTNLLTQKILGNKVDKRSAGISALMGGLAPFSSYVGDKFAGAKDGTFKKLLSEGGKDLSKRLSPFEIAEQGSTGLNRFKLRGDAGFKDIASKLTLDSTLGSSLAAYDAAKKAEEEFDKMMAGKTRTAAEDKAERIARITASMKAAGFPQSKIDEVLIREGYAAANGGLMYRTGGRVGFGDGGTSNRESSGIIEMEMIDPETGQKKQFFGSLYDEDIMSGIITGSITPLETHPLLEGMKKGGRVGFAGGGSGAIYDTRAYEDLYDSYQDDILDGVINIDVSFEDWIQNRNESMMNDGYKKGGRVGLAFGGDPDDILLDKEEDDTQSIINQILKGGGISTAMGDPEDIPTLDNDLGEDEILQILKDGYADNAGGGLGKMQQQLIQLGVDTSKMSPTEIIEIYNRMMGGESGKYFGAKKGGRVGFAEGGTEDRNKMSKLMFQLANAVSDTEKRNILSKILLVKAQGKKEGGIAGLKMGGMPSMEMDYRGGGFIPVGSKEKADDVPARLSKNEFVMTADAVRAAGGGSVNKGAQRMYQLMNGLEARV